MLEFTFPEGNAKLMLDMKEWIDRERLPTATVKEKPTPIDPVTKRAKPVNALIIEFAPEVTDEFFKTLRRWLDFRKPDLIVQATVGGKGKPVEINCKNYSVAALDGLADKLKG